MIKLLFFLFLATPLAAQSPMDADAFEAYSQGKTLYFGYDGSIYGAEEYLPNRRVRWSVLDGKCQDGEWYQDGQMICFVYIGESDPQCWSFYQRQGGLMAQFENDPDLTTLFEIEPSEEPMVCLGPEIGV
ncbi:hypothetical protein [Profundibacter sp.]